MQLLLTLMLTLLSLLSLLAHFRKGPGLSVSEDINKFIFDRLCYSLWLFLLREIQKKHYIIAAGSSRKLSLCFERVESGHRGSRGHLKCPNLVKMELLFKPKVA